MNTLHALLAGLISFALIGALVILLCHAIEGINRLTDWLKRRPPYKS